MRMSDLVANYIMRALDESDGNAEIQRNVLAGELGCVPSQINYVITSRFTPEQGYIVEKQAWWRWLHQNHKSYHRQTPAIMHIVNSIGDKLSSSSAAIMLRNMKDSGIISAYDSALMSAALSDKAYGDTPPQKRDSLRASIFKKFAYNTYDNK